MSLLLYFRIPVDMGFAARCGFKKLLILSGNANFEDVKNWTFSDGLKPDYYLNDLQDLHHVIEKMFKSEAQLYN